MATLQLTLSPLYRSRMGLSKVGWARLSRLLKVRYQYTQRTD